MKNDGDDPKIISGTGFSGTRNRSVKLIRAVIAAHVIDDAAALLLSYATSRCSWA